MLKKFRGSLKISWEPGSLVPGEYPTLPLTTRNSRDINSNLFRFQLQLQLQLHLKLLAWSSSAPAGMITSLSEYSPSPTVQSKSVGQRVDKKKTQPKSLRRKCITDLKFGTLSRFRMNNYNNRIGLGEGEGELANLDFQLLSLNPFGSIMLIGSNGSKQLAGIKLIGSI